MVRPRSFDPFFLTPAESRAHFQAEAEERAQSERAARNADMKRLRAQERAASQSSSGESSFRPNETLSQRADRMSHEARASGTREAHAAAAAAHISAHGAARSESMREHHDRLRGEHAKAAYPHLYEAAPAGTTQSAHTPAPAHATRQPRVRGATQTGAKGGTFVVSASGKKRYVGKSGR